MQSVLKVPFRYATVQVSKPDWEQQLRNLFRVETKFDQHSPVFGSVNHDQPFVVAVTNTNAIQAWMTTENRLGNSLSGSSLGLGVVSLETVLQTVIVASDTFVSHVQYCSTVGTVPNHFACG